MGENKEIIKHLAGIFKDNITYPGIVNEIDRLGLRNIGVYPIASLLPYLRPIKIFRLRLNKENDFSHTSELSYNPDPKSYGRMNLPGCPLFYGTITTQPYDCLVNNFTELKQIIPSLSEKFDERNITITEYRIKYSFLAAAMVFYDEYVKKRKDFQWLYSFFKSQYPKDFQVLREFSFLLSLTEKDKYFSNRITATITGYIFNQFQNMEAILYPSANFSGEGDNIAITPKGMERLTCKNIYTLKLYTKQKVVVTDLLKWTKDIKPDGTFKLEHVPKIYYSGRQESLKRLEIEINKINETHS